MLERIKVLTYRGHSPYYYLRKLLFNIINWREHRRRQQWARTCDRSHNGTLETEGWCEVSVDPRWVSETVAYCQGLDRKMDPENLSPQAGGGKDFWRLLIDNASVKNFPEVIRFSAQSRLKEIASAYLGEEAVLANVSLMKSYPTGRQVKHSQLWHLDAADSRMLLFYLYCSDVDDQAGPFTVVEKSRMKPDWRPRFLRKYGYSDSEIVDLAEPGCTRSITGPAGTMFACDSAQTYHQGSRC